MFVYICIVFIVVELFTYNPLSSSFLIFRLCFSDHPFFCLFLTRFRPNNALFTVFHCSICCCHSIISRKLARAREKGRERKREGLRVIQLVCERAHP
uniref:Putative secreted peptide n=1 Tax=Anopheles braziliensis TaxID=58242 RepID=A0A2M3ZNT2_9DIPT